MPYVDVSAVRMLAELTEDLEQRGVRLLVAGNVGQVRDVVRRSAEGTTLQLYPTVGEALDAVRHSQGGETR
jgi:MFS superfamily sulfate permease-like transporter